VALGWGIEWVNESGAVIAFGFGEVERKMLLVDLGRYRLVLVDTLRLSVTEHFKGATTLT
jgi:hypothetical protein